jgi:hypothetical protein
MVKPLILAGCVFILSSCASLSPEQCRNADWRQIGFTDGANGEPASRLQSHASACAKADIKPDLDAYLSGRMEGLLSYCQPENGFEVGRRGRPDNVGDCPPHLRGPFLDQYRQGREINALEGEVQRFRSMLENDQNEARRNDRRMEEIRRELRRANLSTERRTSLLNEMERLLDRRQDAGRRQLSMQRDLDIAVDRLQFRLREMRR